MTQRRHHLATLLGAFALAFASSSVALAQNEEDPEPEVSDEGPEGSGGERDPEPEVADEGGDVWDRLLAVQVTGGLDTPFGVAGGAIEFNPFRFFGVYAGGGASRSGGRVAGGIYGRAPLGNASVGLQLGLGGGPLDWESAGRTDERLHTSRHWDFALFFHSGLMFEYRWEMGLFGRLSFGVDALLTPEADDCVRGASGDQEACGVTAEGLSKPVRGWAGLTIGYALDL